MSFLLVSLVFLAYPCISQAADTLHSLPASNSESSASCLVPEAGAPSCGMENSPGSASIVPSVPYHVGNPIDVVSGNKYQYELDYKSFSSGLTLSRHYNSSLSIYDTGFGPGWRHTYQVLLTRISANQLNIVQSDGRLVHFYRSSASDNPDVFLPELPGDGYLEYGERTIWYLTDGRRMVFQGSYLVQLDLGNYLGVLSLRYKAGKLRSVTDSHGDVLTFHYVPGRIRLPEYGSKETMQPVGSIASVSLPDGSVIRYQYGAYQNLAAVQYPDEQATGYGYHDSDWPSHLTLRQSTQENRLTEWRYDSSGRAVAWIEDGGANGLEIARDKVNPDSDPSTPAEVGATVTYADGRATRYDWNEGAGGFTGNDSSFDLLCDNCLPHRLLSIDSSEGGNTSVSPSVNIADRAGSFDNVQPADTSPSTNAMDDAIARLWASLKHSSVDLPHQPGESFFEGVYPHEKGNVSFKLRTNRTGHINKMTIGTLKLSELARRSMTESLPP